MTIRSGKLDQPIEIQSVTNSADGMGSVTEVWARIANSPKWAEYIPLKGAERLAAGQLEQYTNFKLRIRRDTNVIAACRVVHKGKTYRINSVEDWQRDNDMVLYCTEVV